MTDKWEDLKGETRILAENKSLILLHNDKKEGSYRRDRRSKLILEVNSVQGLLLFNAFLAKQCNLKLHLISH